MSEMQDRVYRLIMSRLKHGDEYAVSVLAKDIIEAMRELPEEPGPRYSAGEYSRRNQQAMIDDALELEKV